MPSETSAIDPLLPTITDSNIEFSEQYFRLVEPKDRADLRLFYSLGEEEVPVNALWYRGTYCRGGFLYYVKETESSIPRRAWTQHALSSQKFQRTHPGLSRTEKRKAPFRAGDDQPYVNASTLERIPRDTYLELRPKSSTCAEGYYVEGTDIRVITSHGARERKYQKRGFLQPKNRLPAPTPTAPALPPPAQAGSTKVIPNKLPIVPRTPMSGFDPVNSFWTDLFYSDSLNPVSAKAEILMKMLTDRNGNRYPLFLAREEGSEFKRAYSSKTLSSKLSCPSFTVREHEEQGAQKKRNLGLASNVATEAGKPNLSITSNLPTHLTSSRPAFFSKSSSSIASPESPASCSLQGSGL